ncbi:MAG: DUF2062 domain-containing protein [Desulfuromonas sp.]|nr:MAG: DUF2062 domain-containing protein [Desulfuromonas sp.]
MWRRWSLVRQTKLNLLRFIRLHGTPEEIAKGFALGIFIGMTPTFGVQMPIGFFCAWLFRENKLAAVLGVWITNPLTAPFIYAAEYEFGRLLLGMERLTLPTEYSFDTLSQVSWDILLPLLVGSILFAILFGSISYALTIRFIPYIKTIRISRWPRKKKAGQ